VSRFERKWDHIRYSLDKRHDRSAGFEDIHFIHQSLPDISVSDVRIDHFIGELLLSSPIFINAMTGGGGEKTYQINKELANVACKTGIAMAVGSQMSAIKDKQERYTYEVVRKENPSGILIANLGSEANADQAIEAIDMIEANILQIHLNVIQELTMPEGDRDFAGALRRIEAIVKAVKVPVFVKEVGFGMSMETVAALSKVGVKAVDVGGFGGTNFAEIENKRNNHSLPFFNQWGIPTAISIIEAASSKKGISVIGSGGIRTSLDIAKALALGANAVGIAGHFIQTLIKSGSESLYAEIVNLQRDLVLIMTALGAKSISDLKKAPIMISGNTFHWLNQRGIDTKKYSQRRIND
jgi:isopentenyl-diphosphate Delta-isomerase